jgi:hypothetical protein
MTDVAFLVIPAANPTDQSAITRNVPEVLGARYVTVREPGTVSMEDVRPKVRYGRNITVPFPKDDNLFIHKLVDANPPTFGYDFL